MRACLEPVLPSTLKCPNGWGSLNPFDAGLLLQQMWSRRRVRLDRKHVDSRRPYRRRRCTTRSVPEGTKYQGIGPAGSAQYGAPDRPKGGYCLILEGAYILSHRRRFVGSENKELICALPPISSLCFGIQALAGCCSLCLRLAGSAESIRRGLKNSKP